MPGATGDTGPQGETGPAGPVAGSNGQFVYNDNDSAAGAEVYYSGGNVGLGITSPGEKLEVDGNIKVTGSVTVELPKTGQTFSYQTGDDGYLQEGQDVLVDNEDGTVTDIRTGLMWPKDGTGSGYANGMKMSWNDAVDWAESLVLAGYLDWRLPNINELKSFQEATWGHYMSQPKGFYFSSTTLATYGGSALGINFSSGDLTSVEKETVYNVVAVRSTN